MNAVKGETKVKISLKESEIREVAENSTFFHLSKFYPKPKVELKDAKIKDVMKDKLNEILEEYNDIMSHKSTDIGVTMLKEVPIETDPNLPPVVSKLCIIPLKHQEFVRQELLKLLEAGLITRSISPYVSLMFGGIKKIE